MASYDLSLPRVKPPTITASEASLSAHIARFAARLRSHGIDLSLSDEVDGLLALQLVDIRTEEEVFLALRTALKVNRQHWSIFNLIFDQMWRHAESLTAFPEPRETERKTTGRVPFRFRPTERTPTRDEVGESNERNNAGGYTPEEQMRHKTFDECTSEDFVAMQQLLDRLARMLKTRYSRRRILAKRGFRGSLAFGGEMIELSKTTRAVELPHLVLLCDTSGSMDSHSRFLLMFALSLKKVAPRSETFAFNTRLTRLTHWLSPENVTSTVEQLARGVDDWSGGTRIGACLLEFTDSWLTQTVCSDTTLIILSDGLDQGDPDLLKEAMVRLRRRARRIIWLNPLMGDDRYRPEAKGMETALPYIHQLAPAHNLAALEAMLPLLAT
jgi:hypothetical protein